MSSLLKLSDKLFELPEVTSYAPSYPDDEIKIFIESLGYNGDTSKLGKLVRAKLRKEWNFYFDCITKCPLQIKVLILMP